MQFGHLLWYQVNFERLRPKIRNWMAIWYFLKDRHTKEIYWLDEVVMKERRVCQGLLESYMKLRKSQVEHALMRHTQFVICRPNPLAGMPMDQAWQEGDQAA